MHRRHVFDGSAAATSGFGMKPRLQHQLQDAASRPDADRARGWVAATLLALLLALTSQTSQARDQPGDVQRVKMIGFTVADVERQADFFTKVLQFEKISDFRVVGGAYDQMQGCLLYTSPSPRDRTRSRMPSSA